MAFYELRRYTVRPGKMKQWLEFMEGTIIPFQVSKGMVITGGYRGEEDDSVYFWTRRFESEGSREALYAAVYESDFWKNEVAPQVVDLIDRDLIQVTRVVPTERSVAQ
ncbi:MAG: NIPSNAP family protein [Alphaproteobacteria bacterium]|nr:NIPSNAP family protein [Alphaproteobacteria bacterium]